MNAPRVLAVDDDPIALRLIEAALKTSDCTLITAIDLASAKARLEEGKDDLTCILIDYQLPDGHGTELLRWLKEHESPICGVIVTASEAQHLVKETMIEGASNFLQKPAAPEELREAVLAASSRTQFRRGLREIRRQAENAGHLHERLLEVMLRTDALVEYKFCPKHPCGGDFLVHHRLPNGDEVFLVSDVAGHDLGASVQSSFFHGWMSGVFRHDTDVAAALQKYNRMLVGMNDAVGSIAVTALRLERDTHCLTAWNYGGPPPVFVDWRGRVRNAITRDSSPLGWFEPVHPPTERFGVPPGPIWMWTDGLVSLADTLGASPLALAFALLKAPEHRNPPWLDLASDDVLVARLWPGASPGAAPAPYLHPLIAEEHGTGSESEIDSIQSSWKTSLQIALPELPASTRHDVLLGCREALLNAITHGCCGCESASFQVLFHPQQRRLRVRVEDPGVGHGFDWRAVSAGEPSGSHCGLMVMHAVASRVSLARNGAEVSIDYLLSEDWEILRQDKEL